MRFIFILICQPKFVGLHVTVHEAAQLPPTFVYETWLGFRSASLSHVTKRNLKTKLQIYTEPQPCFIHFVVCSSTPLFYCRCQSAGSDITTFDVNIFGVSLRGNGSASAILISDEKANASPKTNACCGFKLVNKSIWLLSSYSIVLRINSKSLLFVILWTIRELH